MLIHTATHNKLKVKFYTNDVPGENPKNTIYIRVDTAEYDVQCHFIDCIDCPLDTTRTAKYIGTDCAERGIDYFKKTTKDKFPEWSI